GSCSTPRTPRRSLIFAIACWCSAKEPWPRSSTGRKSRRRTSSAPRSGRRRMLEGALGTRAGARRPPRARPRRGQVLAQNAPLAVAVLLLVAMLVIYVVLYAISLSGLPGSFEAASITDHAVPLSLAAVGQSLVILTRGIDLSVGGMMDLTNALAAMKIQGGLATEALWTAIILLIGAAGGLLNGVLVAFGRIQPILVTLGTLSIFQGLALWVLPSPGGHVAGGYTKVFLNPN